MSFYTFPLQAGKAYQHDAPGRVLMIDSTGDATGVDVQIIQGGSVRSRMPARRAGFRYAGQFDGVIFLAQVDTELSVFLSMDDVSTGFTDNAPVTIPQGVEIPSGVKITNAEAERIPVDIGETEILAVTPQLATFTHAAAVVGIAAASLVAADPLRRKIIIRNGHAAAKVAIGGAGVTLANGAIHLAPGEAWEEKDGATAEWFAVSDTAATDVQIMEMSQ